MPAGRHPDGLDPDTPQGVLRTSFDICLWIPRDARVVPARTRVMITRAAAAALAHAGPSRG
jgi:hypothetical protein